MSDYSLQERYELILGYPIEILKQVDKHITPPQGGRHISGDDCIIEVKQIIFLVVGVIVLSALLIPIVNDTDNTLNVIVLEGQSNSQYASSRVDPSLMDELGSPSKNVYYYGTPQYPFSLNTPNNPVYDTTFESYNIYSMYNEYAHQWRIGSEDAAICYQVSERYKTDTLVINVSIAGSTIAYLQPDATGGTIINNALNDAFSKIPKKYNVVKVCYVWMQGEADRTTDEDVYIGLFENIKEYYEDKGINKCYLVQTRPENGGNASLAQLTICENDPDVILASTLPSTFTVENGLLLSDNLHYSAEGRYLIGMQVGEIIEVEKSSNDIEVILSILPIIVGIGLLVAAVTMIRGRN